MSGGGNRISGVTVKEGGFNSQYLDGQKSGQKKELQKKKQTGEKSREGG